MSDSIWLLSQYGGMPVGKFCPPWDDWESKDAAMSAAASYGRYEPLSPEQFPKRLVEIEEIIEHEGDFLEAGMTPPRRNLLPLPPIFYQRRSFLFVDETTAELLSGFRLGKAELHKLGLFARDGKTPHDGYGYWVNMLEAHPCLNADLSEGLSAAGYVDLPGRGKIKCWMPPARDTPVISEPLPDLDLWRDPQLVGAFFVRDALAEALKKQKGGNKLRFLRCKVVES